MLVAGTRLVEASIRTVLLCELECFARACKVGASHHKLGAADFPRSLDDAFKIIWMLLRAVVAAAENRIGKIDANL